MESFILQLAVTAIAVRHKTSANNTYHIALLGINSTLSDYVTELRFVKPITELVQVTSLSNCTNFTSTANSYIKLSGTACLSLLPNISELKPKGIKVTSSGTFGMHVFQQVAGKSEGYLAISDDYIGNEYYVITYCALGGTCQFAVTAIADETRVFITFRTNLTNSEICINSDFDIPFTGTSMHFILNEYDVLHIESQHDLTGTHIMASRKVSVFVGSRHFLDQTLMVEQALPVNKWGNEFIVIPNYFDISGDIVKIVTREDKTMISITGFNPFIIQTKGDSVERRVDWAIYTKITSSNPVLIMQIMSVDFYATGGNVGSPSMVLVLSTSHWTSDNGTFVCKKSANIQNTFLAIALHNSSDYTIYATDLTDLTTRSVSGNAFKSLVGVPALNMTDWTYIVSGVLFASYGYCNGEAAYILNANWTKDTEKCVPTVAVPGDNVDNDCDGQIDEDTCGRNDTGIHFVANPIDSCYMPFKSVIIRGADEVRFQLQSCGVAQVTFKQNTSMTFFTIQISPVMITMQRCTTDCSEAVVFNVTTNCTIAQSYTIKWEKGKKYTIIYNNNPRSLNINADGIFEYDEMIVAAAVGIAVYDIDMYEKDCGKIIAGQADTLGTDFIIPVCNTDSDFVIYMTAPAGEGFLTMTISPAINTSASFQALQTFNLEKANFSGTYSSIALHSNDSISVFLLLRIFDKWTWLRILPTDILGTSAHIFLDSFVEDLTTSSQSSICKVFPIGYTVLLRNTVEIQNETSYTIANNYDVNLLNGDTPFALFCGTMNDTLVQIPPKETLGSHFYIPPLNASVLGANAFLRIVVSEDNTVVQIYGEYDKQNAVQLSGTIYSRDVLPDTLYKISATKPIQVQLQVQDKDWASAIIIPPVDQFLEQHLIPALPKFSLLYSSGVDVNGSTNVTKITNTTTAQELTHTVPFFTITVLSYRESGSSESKLFLTSDVQYKDINKVCMLSSGFRADGKDNDCDGLVDEEQCTDILGTEFIDFDIDGEYNEDCSNNNTTMSSPSIWLNILSTNVTCPFTFNNSLAYNYSIWSTWPTQLYQHNFRTCSYVSNTSYDATHSPGPSVPAEDTPTFIPLTESGPVVLIDGTTPSPNVTSAPDEMCITQCPCGWLVPSKNYTKEELQLLVKEIQKNLQVTKDELSATIRTKISVPDERTAAKAVGFIGMLFLILAIVPIVLLDIPTIVRDVKRMFIKNIRQGFSNDH